MKFHPPVFVVVPVVLFLFLSVGGCSILKIERPAEDYKPASYSPRYSYINIPVEADVKSIQELINRKLGGVLYSDTSFEDHDRDNLMLRATKSDSIRISIDRNQFAYRVPLKIWLRKRFTPGILGYNYSYSKDATAEVALKFKTVASLNRDWTINTVTTADGYDWISYPQVMVGLIQIPLPIISDLLVKSNLPTITKEIDKAIKESFNLKTVMSEAWAGMQKPFLLSPVDSLWLKLTPVEVSSVLIRGTPISINHSIGIKALVQLFFGPKPEYSVNSTLPPLKVTSSIPDNFSINFSLDIPFSRINELARKQFRGYTFTYHSYKITVQDITLYGQGENLIVAIVVDGSVKGTIYLSGVPAFNKENMTIELADLDFSIKTRNVLIKTASWMFHSGLIQKMAGNLVFPFGENLRDARKGVNSYFEQNHDLMYFRIKGAVEKLEPDKILISREAVKAYFQFDGKVKVCLQPGWQE